MVAFSRCRAPGDRSHKVQQSYDPSQEHPGQASGRVAFPRFHQEVTCHRTRSVKFGNTATWCIFARDCMWASFHMSRSIENCCRGWQHKRQSNSRCCEDGPHDDPSCLCREVLRISVFGVVFCVASEQDLKKASMWCIRQCF